MVEALAWDIKSRVFIGRLSEVVNEATRTVFGPPPGS